jgi:hypothetical protein
VDGTTFGLVAGESTKVPLEGGGMSDGVVVGLLEGGRGEDGFALGLHPDLADGTAMVPLEGLRSTSDGTAMGIFDGVDVIRLESGVWEGTPLGLVGGDGTTDRTTMGLLEIAGSAADDTAMGLVAGAGWEDGRTADGMALVSLEGNNDGAATGGILEDCSSCAAGVSWDGCADASRCDITTRRGIGTSADAGETSPGSDDRYDRGLNASGM